MGRGLAFKREERLKVISRKKEICRSIYGSQYYKFDGQYSKGKISCGCGLCKPYKGYYPSKRDKQKQNIAKFELNMYKSICS